MLSVEHITPILNVSHVPTSLAWFEKLGWKRSFAWNQVGCIANAADRDEDGEADYAGVCSGNVEIFLCQNGQGARLQNASEQHLSGDSFGVWMTWWLATPIEVEDMYSKSMQKGVSIVMPLTTQPWNAIEFRIRHPDGHTFRVSAFINDV